MDDFDLDAIAREMEELYLSEDLTRHNSHASIDQHSTRGILVEYDDQDDPVDEEDEPTIDQRATAVGYADSSDRNASTKPPTDHDNNENNVRVVIRIRPPLEHELNGYLGIPFKATTRVGSDQRSISLVGAPGGGDERNIQHSFTFDHIYDQASSQRDVYDMTARPLVASCLEGYNATILAYGQTGTGKTYTMEGVAERFEDRGVVPRAIEQIFGHIQESATNQNRFLVRASYLQIYNDVIYDLLKPENQGLQIREDDKSRKNSRGVYVEGLSEWVVRSPQEIFKLMETGAALRATGKTKLNEVSSRSHAVLRLIIEQCETSFVDPKGRSVSMEQFESLIRSNGFGGKSPEQFVRQRFRVAKLNLVDLAGSERVRVSGATGLRLEESRKINRSLSALGNVISALTDFRGRQHIPYRDSKLTRILEDSLGGNCRTAMIAMVSPALDALGETLSTLKFANRAKSIRNTAFVNEDVDKNSLLRKYERELKRLRRELDQRNQTVVDHRVVLELEDQKRRAEADKMAALRALESRSFEFMKEKQAKRKLEEKIKQLESQMLGAEETPQFRKALQVHREKIREEYREKMDDLEREREQIEAQRAQVGRYKQLLLKQRDVMVALTQRLNQRDEEIVSLQDELDTSERNLHVAQERLDKKTAELIHVQRLAMELKQKQQQSGSLENTNNGNDGSTNKGLPSTQQQVGLEARVRALTSQYQTFRDEMTDRLGKKESQIRTLREENAKLMVQLDNANTTGQKNDHVGKNDDEEDEAMLAELERLRIRSVNHAKEQLAMRTIMEKIHVLVLDVMSSSNEIAPEPMTKVKTLCSLVKASVDALSMSYTNNNNQA